MKKKYVALRVRDYKDTVAFLHEQGVSVLHSRLETRDQALRNLTEGLFDQGVERTIDQHELRWMQVEGELEDEKINSWSLCDLFLDEQWFEAYKSNIRHCSGVAYWDATYGLAKELTIKPQDRLLSYTVDYVTPQKVRSKQKKEQPDKKNMLEQPPIIEQIKKPRGRPKKQTAHESQQDLFG